MNYNKNLFLVFIILLMCNIGSFAHTSQLKDNKYEPDTIILKNFWINPKYYLNEKRIYIRQFKSIMWNDQIALRELKIGKSLRAIGYSTAFISGGITGAGLLKYQNTGNGGLLIAGITFFGGSLVIDYFAESKFRDVVNIYNKNLLCVSTLNDNDVILKIVPSSGGLCFKVTF
jgi:hypothetical protein